MWLIFVFFISQPLGIYDVICVFMIIQQVSTLAHNFLALAYFFTDAIFFTGFLRVQSDCTLIFRKSTKRTDKFGVF